MKTLRLGTRGSMLALWQANFVAELLAKDKIACEIIVIKTTGDQVQNRFLHEIGGKGLFVRELEQALASNTIDAAIHSLKDMPAVLEDAFHLPAILPRHSVNDVLLFREEQRIEKISDLKIKKIGTSSLRRENMLRHFGFKEEIVGLRGNVDTRIKKLLQGDFDAIVLAQASLERLQIQHPQHFVLNANWFTPCAGQGALAIETLRDSPWNEKLAVINCALTHQCVSGERRVMAQLQADCTTPVGCFIRQTNENLYSGDLFYFYENGKHVSINHTAKNISEIVDRLRLP